MFFKTTILTKRKTVSRISEQLELSERKLVEYSAERKLLKRENITLKNIIIKFESSKHKQLESRQLEMLLKPKCESRGQQHLQDHDHDHDHDMQSSYLSNPLYYQKNAKVENHYRAQFVGGDTSERSSEYEIKEKYNVDGNTPLSNILKTKYQDPSFYYRDSKKFNESMVHPREKLSNHNFFDFENGQQTFSLDFERTVKSISKTIIKNDLNRTNSHSNIVSSLFVPANCISSQIRSSNSESSLISGGCCSSSSFSQQNVQRIPKPYIFENGSYRKFSNSELLQEKFNHEFKVNYFWHVKFMQQVSIGFLFYFLVLVILYIFNFD